LRQFCDRGLPCSRCANSGRQCIRSEGLQRAIPQQKRKRSTVEKESRPHQQVPKKRPNETKDDEKAPRKKGRPKALKLETTETVKARVKVIDLVDYQSGKPAGIGRPMVWCEVYLFLE
jgi:hypothetical protein